MMIAGVDFSGAKTDDRTWVATGTLESDALTLDDCRPVSRVKLSQMLLAMPAGSVAALDFPFSVPESFAQFWHPGATAMPDLWAKASDIDLTRFLEFRDRFVADKGEPKRLCDLRFPECYSCLHKANPNMVPMTFYGMRMLGPLWQAGCSIPPLENPQADKALLLEAMPGAALKAMLLPHKGYKNGTNALNLRQKILDGLEVKAGVKIIGIDRFRALCLGSHDALDSVVAAVIASMWARDPKVFWCPDVGGPDSVALLEGWLYAPVFL